MIIGACIMIGIIVVGLCVLKEVKAGVIAQKKAEAAAGIVKGVTNMLPFTGNK